MKTIITVIIFLMLTGCDGLPRHPIPTNYEDCIGSQGMRIMVANNIKYADRIREDANACIKSTAVGTNKTNKEDDIIACSEYAYRINGGVDPKVSVFKYGYKYDDVYESVKRCERLK